MHREMVMVNRGVEYAERDPGQLITAEEVVRSGTCQVDTTNS